MLVKEDLEKVIHSATNFKDKDGEVIKISDEMKALSSAVIDTMKTINFNHPMGTIAGATPKKVLAVPVFPMPVIPAAWMLALGKGVPKGKDFQEAVKACRYIQRNLKVSFDMGDVKGTDTATLTSPGAFAGAEANNGKLSGLTGQGFADALVPSNGDKGPTKDIYDAICDYIYNNAEAFYLKGSITGTVAVKGGLVTAGGVMGKIR